MGTQNMSELFAARKALGHYARAFIPTYRQQENFNTMYKEALREAKAEAWEEGRRAILQSNVTVADNPYNTRTRPHDVSEFLETSG